MPDDPLLDHLERTTPLTRGEASRVVADVLSYFAESTEAFVRRRHTELRARGLHNDRIFAQVEAELRGRPVVAPRLSVRQLRRIVYG